MKSKFLVFLALLLILAPSAPADTVFNNIVNRGSTTGYTIAGSNIIGASALGAAFTPMTNYTLTDARAVLMGGGLSGGTVEFSIYSSSNSLPGTELTALGSVVVPLQPEAQVYTVSDPLPALELTANVQYWLVLLPGTSTSDATWIADLTTSVPFAFTHNATGSSGWQSAANIAMLPLEFEIDGTPLPATAPEPASLALFAVAAGALCLLCRKKEGRQ